MPAIYEMASSVRQLRRPIRALVRYAARYQKGLMAGLGIQGNKISKINPK